MSEGNSESARTAPGTLEQALANGHQMLRDHPDMALAQAHAILKRDESNSPALRLAAAAHRALGDAEQAERAELAAIHHSQRIPSLVAAARALDEGRAGEASHIAAKHLSTSPDDLAALALSAESAIALGVADKAEPLLRLVLGRVPSFVPARLLLIQALMRQDKLLESRTLVEDVIASRPNDITALRLLARIQTDLGAQEAAASTYEQLLKLDDTLPDLWILYGDALRFLGRKIDSRLAYQRALTIDPHHGQAWWSIVNLDPAAVEEQQTAKIEDALAARRDQPEHAGNLRFALGTAFDALGRYADAFRHFEAGNILRRDAQPYDPEEISAQIDRHIAALPPGSLPRRRERGSGTAVPIFIVGMPRSGSTLVERILGRHSMVEALGELPIIPHFVEALKLEQPDAPVEPRIAQLAPDQLEHMAKHYLDRAADHCRTGSPFFVDKLHMNWRHLALILRLFPQAPIIDVRRSALDCCWSNYKLLFARGHPAASDLNDLGRFFIDYARFIDHIDRIAPGRIHRLGYEALVEDIEVETRRLLDFLGLPFEEQCLDFHLSDQPVATASSEQVRRPLNRDGIGAWRPYAAWLDPLRDALGPFAGD